MRLKNFKQGLAAVVASAFMAHAAMNTEIVDSKVEQLKGNRIVYTEPNLQTYGIKWPGERTYEMEIKTVPFNGTVISTYEKNFGSKPKKSEYGASKSNEINCEGFPNYSTGEPTNLARIVQ